MRRNRPRFNDCPNTGSAAADVLSQELEPVANGEALAARVFFSEDGWLALPKDLSFEEYQELIVRFDRFHKNMLWFVGDFQAQGEALFGQQYRVRRGRYVQDRRPAPRARCGSA